MAPSAPEPWACKPFADLSPGELYAALSLRQLVFVVEQKCLYLDVDGLDPRARHLWLARGDEVLAYARLFAPGALFAEASLGRVATAPAVRGSGFGRAVVREALARIGDLFGPCPVRIGAQAHLERFYGSFGFARSGPTYDEDGIPHVPMVRPG
jgi:ElaA protein